MQCADPGHMHEARARASWMTGSDSFQPPTFSTMRRE